MNEEYDFDSPPDFQWKRKDGSEIKFYRSKKDSSKYKCFIKDNKCANFKPYNVNNLAMKATNKKPMK